MDWKDYYRIYLELKKEQERRRERAYTLLGIIYSIAIGLFILAVVSLIARCMGVI